MSDATDQPARAGSEPKAPADLRQALATAPLAEAAWKDVTQIVSASKGSFPC
jgi:hypothetical protein